MCSALKMPLVWLFSYPLEFFLTEMRREPVWNCSFLSQRLSCVQRLKLSIIAWCYYYTIDKDPRMRAELNMLKEINKTIGNCCNNKTKNGNQSVWRKERFVINKRDNYGVKRDKCACICKENHIRYTIADGARIDDTNIECLLPIMKTSSPHLSKEDVNNVIYAFICWWCEIKATWY